HLVYRLFSVVLVCSHHEFTSRDHHHLGALGTVPKAVFRLQAASFNADLHLDPVASPWYCDGGRGPGRGGWCLGWHDDCYLLLLQFVDPRSRQLCEESVLVAGVKGLQHGNAVRILGCRPCSLGFT